jgi:hypothetical protein
MLYDVAYALVRAAFTHVNASWFTGLKMRLQKWGPCPHEERVRHVGATFAIMVV